MEELLVTGRSNALVDPGLHIWTWEVAMYLFLGGLTAGVILIFCRGYDRDGTRISVAPFAALRAWPCWRPSFCRSA